MDGLRTARFCHRTVLADGRRPGGRLVSVCGEPCLAWQDLHFAFGHQSDSREQVLRGLVQRAGHCAGRALPGPRLLEGRCSQPDRWSDGQRQCACGRLGGCGQPPSSVRLHLSLRLCNDLRDHGFINLFRADGSLMASDMASSTFPWLTLAIFVPIVAGLVVLLVGRDEKPELTRVLSLVGAVLGFLVTIPLYTGFDPYTANMQFVELTPWIESFSVNYHLGIDGISLWFALLTAFITIIVVLAGWEVITNRVAQYVGAFLILSGLMIGVFAALDAMLCYVFFEATLIPMYLIIGVWGGPRRVYA